MDFTRPMLIQTCPFGRRAQHRKDGILTQAAQEKGSTNTRTIMTVPLALTPKPHKSAPPSTSLVLSELLSLFGAQGEYQGARESMS